MPFVNSRLRQKERRKLLSRSVLILFLRQLSMLLHGNIALDHALLIIADSGARKEIRNISEELHQRIEDGARLSEAMDISRRFRPLLSAMVRTAEESGMLAPILGNYTDALERQETTSRKIRQAMMYPLLLTLVSVSVVAFLLLRVIPSFALLFADAGMRLPLPTRLLLSFSTLSTILVPVLLGLLLFLILGVLLLRKSNKGEKRWHDFLRSLPFIGALRRDMHTAYLAELMALFFESNVDLLQFLEIMAKGTKNRAEESNLRQVYDCIREGESASRAFDSTGAYNPVFVNMLRVGEESGQVSEVMTSIASYLDMDIQLRLSRVTTLLEPAMILLLSLIIGFIVLAIAMPMFQIVQLYDI